MAKSNNLIEKIFINWNCEKSIKQAEVKKSRFENSGYRLIYSSSNMLTYIYGKGTYNEIINNI